MESMKRRASRSEETDATKRALATFGKAFGLALYAGQANAKMEKRRSGSQAPANETHKPSAATPQQLANGATTAQSATEADSYRQPADGSVTEVANQGLRSGIDKSTLALSEPQRLRDKEHLRFVASQPCLLCSAFPCDAHHLRFAQPRALGRKVGDDFTVPLCRQHHRDLHDSGNEAAWWHDMGIDALEIAKDLWNESVTARLKAVG
jgi:hypothetical protein